MELDIDRIKHLVEADRVQWSGHILTRMQQRGIKIKEVIESILAGDIIESYSDDYPYPSCLVLGSSEGSIVCSIGEGYLWMITAYYPDSKEWMEDFKTRRGQA